ncbi:CaiB/BaiF CoA transferase family protein [Stella sp.]|uniref:CaiB/BaiF CoA transferase family protein n=1 Tax=Stella sp. TaxID=2912054 RepID=UPI0035B0EA4C
MPQDQAASPPLPLAGIRVFEIGTSVAAPYAGLILASLGAELVKVERPEGDDARHWGPPFWHGASSIFQVFNVNKRSVVVDLKDAEALARLKALIVETGDAVLQNMRPGQVEKYGLDAATLQAAKPSLVYCNIGAFGATGPLRSKPGYDPLMQAFGGLMMMTGEEGRPPVRVGTSLIDMGTGMWCALGIVAALLGRQKDGRGARIDTSLYETALAWMTYHAADFLATGVPGKRNGSATRGIAPYQAYRCADGYLMVAAPNDGLFRKLSAALGHPEWAGDPRFVDNPSRVANLPALNAMIEAILATKPRAEWQAVLEAAGIPTTPTQTIDEVVVHPQTAALGMLQKTPDGRMDIFGLPMSFDGQRPPLRNAAPELGADTDAVLPAKKG